jgi:hypothetical protein
VATGDVGVLRNLRRICAPAALLEVVIGLDPVRDRSEMERLGLMELSLEMIVPNYVAAGFDVFERGVFAASEWPELNTSWAKRLQGNEGRTITYLIARAR